MDGLEAVELRLSEVLENNDSERIDSEYFQKKYLNLDKIISNTIPLKNISKVTDGDHSKFPENQKKEVRYLRSKDIKNYYLDNHDPIYVSSEYAEKQKRSYITEHNILISIMGNVGDITITPDNFKKSIANRAVAIIKNIQNINAYYLFGYLITKYAFLNIERLKIGGVQLRINLEVLEQLKIPTATKRFQKMIESVIKESHKKQEQSKTLYKEAENLLLEELGLLDYAPSKQRVSVKSFSQSFGSSGRLDSEYYLPKYDEIIEKIKSYKCGWEHIQDVLTSDIKSGTTPKTIIKEYRESSNYFFRAEAFNDDLTLTYENLYSMDNKTYSEHPNISVEKNDILVSMTGTIGNVAIVDKDINGIINQNIVKLSAKDEIIKYFVLALYMKTVGKILLTREQTGNVQPYVNIPNFSNLIVPLFEQTTQLQIETKIKESFRLKKESQNLLELAKKAVEVAIEEGEDVAMGLM